VTEPEPDHPTLEVGEESTTVLSIASANPDGAFMIDELADAFAANASLQG
jgi:hypothetical protein